MKKFATILRNVLLAITLLTGLIICIFHIKPETTSAFDALLLLIFSGAGALYIIVSLISMLVRHIRRARMEETDQMKDTFRSIVIYRKNYNMLNFFRRISFFGTIMLIINLTVFSIPNTMIIGGPYSTDVFLSGYHGFLLWSLIALVASFILSVIFFAVYMPHYGTGAYNIFQYCGKLFLSDVTAPLRIIKSFFNSDNKNWLGLTTMIIFILVNVIAILKYNGI